MLPNLGQLRVSPTGGRDPFTVEATDEGDATPADGSRSRAALKAVLDEVFGNEELRDKIMLNILSKDFKNTDLEQVCEQALQYCAFHPINAEKCRNNPDAWKRLIAAVFDDRLVVSKQAATQMFPDLLPPATSNRPTFWQTYFFALCKRYKEYRTGAIRLVKEELPGIYWPFFSMAAVLYDGLALESVPVADRTPELCMAAVRQNGLALEFVPRSMHTPAIVEAALAQNVAAAILMGNLETAIEVVLRRPELLRFDMPYLNSAGLRYAVLQRDGSAFQYFHIDDRRDESFVLWALASFPWALQWIPADRPGMRHRLRRQAEQQQRAFRLDNMTPEQRADRHYVLNVVRHDGLQLQHASQELRNDPDVAKAAVAQNASALQYVGAGVRANPEFIKWLDDTVTA